MFYFSRGNYVNFYEGKLPAPLASLQKCLKANVNYVPDNYHKSPYCSFEYGTGFAANASNFLAVHGKVPLIRLLNTVCAKREDETLFMTHCGLLNSSIDKILPNIPFDYQEKHVMIVKQ